MVADLNARLSFVPASLELAALAALVPVLRPHDVIGHPQSGELVVQSVTEGSRLAAGVDFAGHSLLPGHEVQQALEVHFLQRLRGRPVQLPGDVDVIPLRVGVDPELDRFVGLGIGGFVIFHDDWQAGNFQPCLKPNVI